MTDASLGGEALRAIHGVDAIVSGRRSAPRRIVERIRFQLPTGLVLAAVVPLAFQYDVLTTTSLPNVVNTAIGVAVAVLVGYYALRRLGTYPTMREVGAVLPVFSVVFMTVAATFLAFRFDYSRFQFLLGYAVAVAWFAGVTYASWRGRRTCYAVVPVGEALSIRDVGAADWAVLDAPVQLPRTCAGVVVDLHADLPKHWDAYVTGCVLAGVPVYHYKQMRETLTGRLEIEHLHENILGAHDPHLGYLKIRRIFDVVTAATGLLVLAVPLLVLAAVIRWDSPGPALFTQARVMRGGRVFTMYKFRTMYAGTSDPRNHEDAMTRTGDARITRIGAFLRRSRIDELPQMVNILKGEMSWIGPRPEALPLAAWYRDQLPFYDYRHVVPPGLTGWAQVNQGHVTRPDDVLSKLHYDFYYVKHVSLWLDLLIVLRTIRTILTGFGAR
ncbi:sugar transferase [Oharaeibacter diazotrophicus]|uniref:Lipopolysaccharide/colanic/teichoic acid biosynthesis glycosyltransferase n=1 Tax=Oharaeibacter diazotrophicus TaxID=1920512 RepID=A0A4R6R9M0_9HYPH|nr:sugar transferase [Oharaeibacter diazotrophicus]TDP82316.1 lipopolysaccharide/colanic/teichoic acid biosynthesis glycosyltransferase [Oharaeibacter diazotrophicus]BBE72921.1 UDP-N-acetylgalactosamine-undecaprenyl-phosphate N-acetylgalactosamine phosphotransferase [Pleomorphomonas sp. SM30]GLS76959.1 glycosyl transferase [Oharaeibacter diazotrophicus]